MSCLAGLRGILCLLVSKWNNPVKTVAVKQKGATTIGLLYFETEEHLVLLNNVFQKAHLGPLRNRRQRHFEPEAHIVIIPRSEVAEVVAFEVLRTL
jgi:hypothetical protein